MPGLDRTWQGMVGHDMASQGMQGVAHMAGSDHSYESSLFLSGISTVIYLSINSTTVTSSSASILEHQQCGLHNGYVYYLCYETLIYFLCSIFVQLDVFH